MKTLITELAMPGYYTICYISFISTNSDSLVLSSLQFGVFAMHCIAVLLPVTLYRRCIAIVLMRCIENRDFKLLFKSYNNNIPFVIIMIITIIFPFINLIHKFI